MGFWGINDQNLDLGVAFLGHTHGAGNMKLLPVCPGKKPQRRRCRGKRFETHLLRL